MRNLLLPLFLAAIGAAALPLEAQAPDSDPYLWLEDVSGTRAMEWVNGQNAKSLSALESDPRYAQFYAQALAIAEAKDRIPVGRFLNGEIYNFWQDAEHVRGILRKTSLADYQNPAPSWKPVIDLDALAAGEKANWVYKGMQCALPQERRCLVSLSDGGEDAVTIREFDLVTGKFVDGGFNLPKGKQRVAWEDENTLLISRDWGPGTLGRTGYPFIVKRLKRGQPLSAAVELYRGSPEDGGYGVTPVVLRDSQNRTLSYAIRPLDTFRSEKYLLGAKGATKLAVPERADLQDLIEGRVIVSLSEDWRPAGAASAFPMGSLLSLDLAQLRANPAGLKPALVYTPGPREALQSVAASRGVLLVSMLDNVRGRMLAFTPQAGGKWARSAIKLPENSTINIADVSQRDDRALMAVTGFLTPPSLWLADAATGEAKQIKSQPAKFDASNLTVAQFEATSKDGTKVPYFVVHRRDMKLDGNNPTLINAYGGFEVSQTPGYSATRGKLWLERGGVFVLANIRGGGEFGPKWHQAGLNVKRQVIYDDFAAVAEDLIARKVTTPRRLGITGGSNGGLLTGVQFTQRPELWNAVVIDVPLLDMLRISQIAAGASWEGEYGSVKDPAVRAFWQKLSPYHNLRKDVKYPEPFIFTTTKDDRVGPQHARKFAARMAEMGLPYYYYENTEGGHQGGANLKQLARINALQMVYLSRKLMDEGTSSPSR
jgi:prolyl oligopeptidase